MNKKVMVGMSGGVDSSVAAAILLDQGYDVIGVTLKLWDDPSGEKSDATRTCCSLEDIEDARSVAFSLDIPFYVLNMKDLFRDKVVSYFINSYLNGETPNPCIACNQHLKFDAMLNKAFSLGCDYIATGHYARIGFDEVSGKHLLRKGADSSKDQSYVLYMLTQEQLKHTLFPLGDLKKTEIREMAGGKNMRVRNKRDSQDICFVTGECYGDFIRSHLDQLIEPGNFIDQSGKILGKHTGIVDYTVGQRKGLGIAAPNPLYVVDKNVSENTVILSQKADTLRKSLLAKNMNYIAFDHPPQEFDAKVKVRYTAREAAAIVYPEGSSRARIEFQEPQPFIARGQSVVLYDGDIVLGGGIVI